MNRLLLAVLTAVSLVAATGCDQNCPHVCYCCHSVSTQGAESRCADSSYTVIMPSGGTGPICTSCKDACGSKAPGTTAIACRDYGPTGENAGCTVDE